MVGSSPSGDIGEAMSLTSGSSEVQFNFDNESFGKLWCDQRGYDPKKLPEMILGDYKSLTLSQQEAFTDSQRDFICNKTNQCPLNALVIIFTQAFQFKGTTNQVWITPGEAGMLFDAFGLYDDFVKVWVANFGLRGAKDQTVFCNGQSMLEPHHFLEDNDRLYLKDGRYNVQYFKHQLFGPYIINGTFYAGENEIFLRKFHKQLNRASYEYEIVSKKINFIPVSIHNSHLHGKPDDVNPFMFCWEDSNENNHRVRCHTRGNCRCGGMARCVFPAVEQKSKPYLEKISGVSSEYWFRLRDELSRENKHLLFALHDTSKAQRDLTSKKLDRAADAQLDDQSLNDQDALKNAGFCFTKKDNQMVDSDGVTYEKRRKQLAQKRIKNRLAKKRKHEL